MKFTCNKNDLLNSVTISMRGIPNRTTMPILECLRIMASGDVIRFNSTDTEISVENTLFGEVEENGAICVEAKLFSEIVKKLPDGTVTFSTKDTTATIKCGKSKFTLNTKDADAFPSFDNIDRSKVLKLTQESLKELISQTIFSVAVSNANKLMTGVHFKVSDNKLTVTALDGHRVAIREWQALTDDIEFIIPSKTLLELSKVLSEGDIDLYITDTSVLFEFGDTGFQSRLLDGTFFDVQKLLSDNFTSTVKVDRKALIDSLDRSTLLIRENDRKPVILDISDVLKVQIDTPLGSMNEEMEIEITGDQLTIGLNPKFMLEALRAIGDSEVTLYFINEKSPCYIKGDGYIYMILPVKY